MVLTISGIVVSLAVFTWLALKRPFFYHTRFVGRRDRMQMVVCAVVFVAITWNHALTSGLRAVLPYIRVSELIQANAAVDKLTIPRDPLFYTWMACMFYFSLLRTVATRRISK